MITGAPGAASEAFMLPFQFPFGDIPDGRELSFPAMRVYGPPRNSGWQPPAIIGCPLPGRANEPNFASGAGFVARGWRKPRPQAATSRRWFNRGDLILISGEGAGKSTPGPAAPEAARVAGAIPSPTFTIGRLYEQPSQRMPVSHLDLYRLDGLEMRIRVFWPGIWGRTGRPSSSGPAVRRRIKVKWPRVGRVAIDHIDSESRRIRIDLLA